LGVSVLGAKDLTAYRVGDFVDADIVTPVALNVLDPAATAALKSSEALKTPAIFRSNPGVTNVLASQFQAAFEGTRSNFINALQGTFHATVLDHATITSPDFGYFVTAFNIDNRKFPITSDLAMDWAYGKDGAVEKRQWLDSLLETMRHSIRPDELPAGINMGETVRLLPVTKPNERLTPADGLTRGELVSVADLATLSQVRMSFRREFTDFDELPTARALAAWVQPNCLPDVALTQSTREWSVRQLVVGEYYSAGQIVAPKGSVVDSKIKAALDGLAASSTTAFAAVPPARDLNEPQPSLAMPALTVPALTEARPSPEDQIKSPKQGGLVVIESSKSAQVLAQMVSIPQSIFAHGYAQKRIAHKPYITWPVAAGVFALAMLAMVVGQVRFQQGRVLKATPVKTKDTELKNLHLLQTELAPQLVQIVRQAFVQELAGQRRELLVAQQTAAAEVIRLVHRMDALQVAMQERLRTYEAQIQTLEADLTARTEENRQLIRLKIQMIRHQVDAESGAKRIEFN
jgi:hypothetical protein